MTSEQVNEYRLRYQRFRSRYENIYTPLIDKALKDQIEQFISYGTVMAIHAEPLYEVITNLYLTVAPVWAAYSNSLLRKNKARMPMGFSERIVEAMKKYFVSILNICEMITDTTRDIIRKILGEAAQSGASFDEIVKEVRASTELGKVRARLIARTEVIAASNLGSITNARSTGLELNKVWISTFDKRTRRVPVDQFDHLHMNGITIPIAQLFQVTGEQLDYPGDKDHGASAGNVCNCRCTVAYVVVE